MASALTSSLLSSHPPRPSLSSKTLTLNPFLISKPVRPRYLIAIPSRRARAALTVDSPAADRGGVKEENPEVLLEVKDESRQEILRGVNLTVREGEVHAIMGKNGSGKSTLSKVLVGHPDYEVTGGSAVFKGENLLHMEPEERSHAGTFMSFQTPVEIPGVSNIDFLRRQPEMSPIEVAVEQSLKDENVQISEDVDAAKSGPSILKDNVKKITDTVTLNQPKAFKKERNPTKICSSPRSKLESYQILKYPLFTESAMKNISDHNTLVFIVNIRADKKNIREAVEKMCNVQTKKINTLITPNGTKKAFVALPVEYNAVDVAKKMFKI